VPFYETPCIAANLHKDWHDIVHMRSLNSNQHAVQNSIVHKCYE